MDTDPIAGVDAPLAASNQRLLGIVFRILGADEPASGSPGGQHTAGEAAYRRPWVLCVDDDPEYSLAMKRRLEAAGISVRRAIDGSEGLRRAVGGPADAILLDYQLPDGQGDLILSQLKANPATKDIPVIVITGRNDRALAQKMMNMGAARFMTKPPNYEELLKELRRYVRMPVRSAESLPP